MQAKPHPYVTRLWATTEATTCLKDMIRSEPRRHKPPDPTFIKDQGSTDNHSPVNNFAHTVTKCCVMWEGQALPHNTKFGNCRDKIVDSRAFPSWSLIHGSSWSGLIKVEPGNWFDMKMQSQQYWNLHYGDKTIIWSYYLHSGISYIVKTSLYWTRVQVIQYCQRNLMGCCGTPSVNNYFTIFSHQAVMFCSYHPGVLSLHWRDNERDGVFNHRRIDCLLSRFFRLRSKKISRLRLTVLWEGNSPVTAEFPARTSNEDNFSVWWRQHVLPEGSTNEG